jgi:actin related protein 2/3 complex subunit 2
LFADELIKKITMLKANVLGAPIDKYLTQLQAGQASTPAKLAVRSDTVFYFFPKADRCTIVCAVDFHQKSDFVIGKVFLNAFVEARRSINTAPIAAFDMKPPLEMRHFGIEEAVGTTGFLSLTLMKEHVATPEKKATAVGMLHMLRNYLQYHIKCSKAFFHQRMRARVVALLQVMNRSRQEEVGAKAKKTASGRTFNRTE